jgi:hypothetical protein
LASVSAWLASIRFILGCGGCQYWRGHNSGCTDDAKFSGTWSDYGKQLISSELRNELTESQHKHSYPYKKNIKVTVKP